MPIEFPCSGCGKTLRVPDYAAGLAINCPECQANNRVPNTGVKAESAPFPPPQPTDFPVKEEPPPGEEDERRRPCPMCGEMILASAIKCRYCGEVLDETLRRQERRASKQASRDADMDAIEWVVAILCSGIGCIIGIIWMIQGKPKGGKMFGISLLFIFIWTAINLAIQSAAKRP
jgi:phage FluMu protein Com